MSECTCHIAPPCSYCESRCPRCEKGQIDDRSEGWETPACAACYEKAIEQIPTGYYCYERLGDDANITNGFKIRPCPYWSSREDKEYQQNGHCALLGFGDWEQDGLSLLWDQVKECREKTGDLQDP